MEDIREDAASAHMRQRETDGEACLEAAIFYLSLGWSVLALCPPDHVGVGREHGKTCKDSAGKRPLGFWKEFQDRLPTEAELRAKWSNVNCNVGIALGPVSGMIRIDVEGAEGEKALQTISQGDLPFTLEFQSGRSDNTGRGLLYKIPDGSNLRTTSEEHGKKQELRFQARGAQTALPPSRHKDGNLYTWKKGQSPGVIDAAMAPAWLIAELTAKSDGGKRKDGGKDLDSILDGVEEGNRNETAASFIGMLLLSAADIGNSSTIRLNWGLAKIWNNQNDPPLPDEELKTTFNSILRKETERRDLLDEKNFDSYVKEQVRQSVEKQKNREDTPREQVDPQVNGHINGTPKKDDNEWHLVIVESDPKEFRLRAPMWAACEKLQNGYLILNERQIRCWTGSPDGIPQAAYSQALVTTMPGYKGWSNPGGPLDMLTREATVIAVAPENKKALYMLGFIYRFLMTARDADASGQIVWPTSGRPTRRVDGAVVFKLDNLKKAISYQKEDFSIRSATRLLEEYGASQTVIDNTRWWELSKEALTTIGKVTLEGI